MHVQQAVECVWCVLLADGCYVQYVSPTCALLSQYTLYVAVSLLVVVRQCHHDTSNTAVLQYCKRL